MNMEDNNVTNQEQYIPENSCNCGPGGCKPKPKNRFKKLLFLVIIVAAAGLIIFKLASPSQGNASSKNSSGTCVSSDKGCCGGTSSSDSCKQATSKSDSAKKEAK